MRFLGLIIILWLMAACGTPQPSIIHKKDQIDTTESSLVGNSRVYHFQALPKRNQQPDSNTSAARSVADTSSCLQSQIRQTFKLPDEFFEVKTYTDKSQSITLVNPFTRKEGLVMDVVGSGVNQSDIRLYANGATLSGAWRRLPQKCR